MKTIDLLSIALLIVGGLNWGLVGLAQFDLVATLFGANTVLSSVVYTLVGLAALVQVGRLVGRRPATNLATNR